MFIPEEKEEKMKDSYKGFFFMFLQFLHLKLCFFFCNFQDELKLIKKHKILWDEKQIFQQCC